MSLPISVVVITKNEAQNIERCLQSVSFLSDLVVLDSGSTDETQAIAARLGAKVFVEPWRGFGPQKRRAVELAAHDWVLSLDGDEALDQKAQDFMKGFLKVADSAAAFRFERESFHLGRWIRHGGWSPDYQIRLFHRKKANWDEAVVHEKVLVDGPIKTAEGRIQHWVFRDLAHQVETNNRYSSLGAKALYEKGRRFHVHLLISKPFSKFFETYLFKRGFLDGGPGFIISIGAAYSVFLKWAKLWELERQKGKDQG